MKLISIVILLFTFTGATFADESIKIGVLSGLSGAASKWNRYQNMGITLAKEELEKKGKKFDLIFEDSATNAKKAILGFNKLVTLDKVDAVIANDFGFALVPLLSLAKKHEKLLLSLSMPHKKYCDQGDGYFYSISSKISDTKDAFENFFKLNPDVRNLAVFVFDDPEWGNSYLEVWKDVAKSFGIKIVYTFKSDDLLPDFKAPFAKALKEKPDAVFVAHEPESFLKIIAQYKYKGKVLFANHVFEVLANSMDRISELKGFYVVDPILRKKGKFKFREKFVKRFSKEPILEAYAGYESLIAISKAFSFNRERPYNGITEVAYRGVSGVIDFTGNSCAGNYANWGLYKFGSTLELQTVK